MALAQPHAHLAAGNAGEEPSRWVRLVRRLMESSAEELGAVPKLLWETKPDGYAPQHFAIGPYHYQRPELKDMDGYKLAAVKHAEENFAAGPYHYQRPELKDMEPYKLAAVKRAEEHFATGHKFVGKQQTIRALYHRYTLALMMAIDTCLLLDFLEGYHVIEATDMVSSSSNWINHMVRGAMMLENQIPLFLFAESLQLRHTSPDVCPIKTTALALVDDVANNAHLLELLYNFVMPASAVITEDAVEVPEKVVSMDSLEQEVPDYDKVKQACMLVSSLDIEPVRSIKSLSGRIMSKVPQLAGLMPLLGKLLASVDVEARLKGVNMGTISNSPLLHEIKIPSVEKLANCGVRLVPAPEGISGFAFDVATATLSLPVIHLDGNTEVILRNLVAYETGIVHGQLVMARYTELMNGIIDTAKDVKILRECKIVFNGMKSDKEAADMWNVMCRAVRPSKVSLMDRVIKEQGRAVVQNVLAAQGHGF